MAIWNPVDIACAGDGPFAGAFLGQNDTGCAGADTVEWTQLAGPAASQIEFIPQTPDVTLALAPNPGLYTIQRCCIFQVEGPPQSGTPDVTPGIQCPGAAIVGEIITLTLNGCENGIVTWSSSGNSGVITPVDNQTALLSIVDDAAGLISITANCQLPDQALQTFTCDLFLYPEDQEFDVTVAPSIQLDVVECGEICVYEEVDVLFTDCEAVTPEKDEIEFPGKPELPPLEKPEPTPLTRVRMTGSPLPPYNCSYTLECCGQEECCCDEHVSAILWNDVFNCGWEYDAPAVNGTNIYNAMGYNPGGKWCFQGTTTINLSGPPAFIDTLVLWGHNMTDATITTSPLVPFGGGPATTNIVSDKSCLEGVSLPIIVYFDQVNDSVTNLSITITPADPSQVICISHVFAGQKFFFNENWGLPEDWTNPFFGSDREVTVREGSCGPVSVTSKRKRISCSIPIDCYSDAEYKECIKPILRYAHCGNPLMFAWSINQCPTDLFYGWVDGTNEGSSKEDCFNTNSIDLSGFITQPQVKDFI